MAKQRIGDDLGISRFYDPEERKELRIGCMKEAVEAGKAARAAEKHALQAVKASCRSRFARGKNAQRHTPEDIAKEVEKHGLFFEHDEFF
jgi:nicotinic acid mononucleotide adenylyltransferase